MNPEGALRRLAEGNGGAILLLALVVIAFFFPSFVSPDALIWSRSGLGSDIASNHWHELTGYAASLRAGRIALWSSSVALGRPLAGDPDSLFLYPFDALFLFLPPALAFNVFDAAHVFLAGLFTFLLLRVGWRVSPAAALFGGLSFAFAPKMMVHLAVGHVGVVAGLAWVPAVWLALLIAFDGSLLAAALAGLGMALQMLTHLYLPYFTALIASLAWLWRIAVSARRGIAGERGEWKRVRRLAAAYAVWLLSWGLLAAAMIGPFLELVPYSSRVDLSLADANIYALPPALLLTLFAPTRTQVHEWTIFLGVLPPLLGLLGLRESRQGAKWALALLACFALIYALGANTPLFALARAIVPGLSMLRVPTRLWFFGGLAVSLLAGFGLDAIADEPVRQGLWSERHWLLRAAGIYLVGGAAAFAGYWAIFRQWHTQIVIQLIVALILIALGWAWMGNRIGGRALQWLLIPVLMLDLLPLAASNVKLVNPRAEFLTSTPAFDFISAQGGIFRVYSPPGDLSWALAAMRNVELLEAQLGLQIEHAVKAINLATGCDKSGYAISIPICLDDITPTATPDAYRLGLLNVRYVVNPKPLADPNFKLVFSDSQFVYENLLWQPRARVLPDGTAEIVNRRAGEYEIVIESAQSAELIVSETWLPGWQAVVDGRPSPVERVEGALIGVRLNPGRHTVRLQYLPLGWRIGWAVSSASLLGLTFWLSVVCWRRIAVAPQRDP